MDRQDTPTSSGTASREKWKDVRVTMVPRIPYHLRPEYCPCESEETHPECPACPATVKGDDIVRGVCQARSRYPAPTPLLELITVRK